MKRILVVLFLLLFALSPSVVKAQFGLNQERIPAAQWSRGFHGLNMLAEGSGLERISVHEFSATNSAEVLVVVMGRLNNLPLNVTNHVGRGGAVLIASDSEVPLPNTSFAGIQFEQTSYYAAYQEDAFGGMNDCPIVRPFVGHPIFTDVNEIVTNRPGYLEARRTYNVASLPPNIYDRNRELSFVAVKENSRNGRVIAVGDQSVFTNQMIFYGDNARFASQAINWLKDSSRKKLLVLVDGVEYSNLAPEDVVVDLPPPSRREVWDALQNLPPEAMLEFANSVATVVEDENMVNDFIHDSVDRIPQSALNRFYIFLLFGVACLSFIATYVCQRKLQSQTASSIAGKKSSKQQNDLKMIQFRERKQAAHYLLDQFCLDVAGKRFSDWPSFPTELKIDEDRDSKDIFESMTRMSVLYKSRPTSFWKRKKLAELEKEVNRWRKYFTRRATHPMYKDQNGPHLTGDLN